MDQVRVLQVCAGGKEFGGVENFLYQYYLHINHEKIHFDFLFCSLNSMKDRMNDSVLKESEFFVLEAIHPNQSQNGYNEYKTLICKLYRVLSRNSFDIIHINTGSIAIQTICILIAHIAKVPVRIAHSHSSPQYSSLRKEIIFNICRKIIVKNSTYLCACSISAGKRLFGKKGMKSQKFHLIKNAIDIEKYRFSEEKRKEIRNRENLCEDELVCCFVGRLDDNKNPIYLLDVFDELHRKHVKSKLWMIGDGELKEDIKKRIRQLGIDSSVIMYGMRNDVPEMLQASDVLIFPSKHEGLSLVVVEAQAAGLFVVVSDTISREHKMTDTIHFLPLDIKPIGWSEYIRKNIRTYCRQDEAQKLAAKGYDIFSASNKMEEFYVEAIMQGGR